MNETGIVRVVRLLLAAVCVQIPFALLADPRAGGPAGSAEESEREEIQETVEIYMLAKMKRFLNLSDEQERKVIPLVEELNASRREMSRKRRLLMLRIHPLVEDEATDEARIAELLDELDRIDAGFRDREQDARRRIREALTPRQQARFLIFQERFRHELQERLRRIQQRDGPGPTGPRRGAGQPRWNRPK